MPTYQYACTECGEQLEKVQKFSDDPLTVCPNCSGRLRKVFSPVGIVFKGSGFYRTDSRAGSNGSLTGKDQDGKDGAGKDRADSGSKSESKSDGSSSDKSSAKSDSSPGSSGKDSGSSSSGSSSSSPGKSTGEKVA
ncbi:MAG TPA: FmdB family zinc ribbon protein [Streptosporangiaceae bacterium]